MSENTNATNGSTDEENKVYVVKDESDGQLYVFEDLEDAKKRNRIGHWRRHALYTARLYESDDEELTEVLYE